jgi:prephenate dehydrogenase/chorismate mutase/prephenate dehydrogenase
MKITVLGSSGRFGSFVSEYFRSQGNTVISLDMNTSQSNLADSLSYSDISLLATPLKEAISYIEEYSDLAHLVEVCSVKAPFRKYSGKILSIHPFFGPESFKDPSRRKIALITDICPVGSELTVKKLFPDCSVIKMNSDEHDRMMASEQELPYLISLYFRESGRSIPPFTGSGRILKEIIQLSEKESIDVMKDSIAENLEIKVLLSEMYEFFRQISSSK